jgi:hypothetical protein
MSATNPSKIISKILSPALQLWLRSQLDQVESLALEISGSDRQILRGSIPLVALSSRRAVYQGLHLGQVEVTGENISVNLGAVLKGQALRLTEPILVSAQVVIDSNSLNSSLASPLLSDALTDLLGKILTQGHLSNHTYILQELKINWQEFQLEQGKLTLLGNYANVADSDNSVTLCTGLSLANSHTLRLHDLSVEIMPGFGSFPLEEFLIDLGSQVRIEELTLREQEIVLSGCLKVTN